jgi:hypothetical protein
MIPRVAELGGMLEVSKSDLRAIEHMKRQRILEKVAHIALPAISAILGIVVGSLAVPVREPASYPYGPLAAASSPLLLSSRRSWAATIVVSLVLFIVAFTVIAWINTGLNGSLGVSPKYSVYSGHRGAEG